MPQMSFNSPLGPLTVFEEDGIIVALDWGWPPETQETPLLLRAVEQLEAYFNHSLTQFDLPMQPYGTDFQHRVWDAMSQIPFGQTRTYKDLADQLGTSPRAIGMACGRNPIPILIPCHRIVGSNGSLGGYSAMDGVETKLELLKHENPQYNQTVGL